MLTDRQRDGRREKKEDSYLISHSCAKYRATLSQQGRQDVTMKWRTETFITDTGENTWHSLPARENQDCKWKMEHSLAEAVTNNHNNAKKH